MSKFSLALKNLLESDNFMARNDWPNFLFSSKQDIDDWTNDISFPESHQLKILIDIAKALVTKNTQKSLDDFVNILSLPAVEVTPFEQKYITLNEVIANQEIRL